MANITGDLLWLIISCRARRGSDGETIRLKCRKCYLDSGHAGKRTCHSVETDRSRFLDVVPQCGKPFGGWFELFRTLQEEPHGE